MSKVIIAGGRDFNSPAMLEYEMEIISRRINITEVVCGGAVGADHIGSRWAINNDIPVVCFYADWQKHGRAAGPIRNREMAEYADALVAFWDGLRGTLNMIHTADRLGLQVEVVRYDGLIVPTKV